MCSGASIPVIEAAVVMVRRFALFFFIFLLAFFYISLLLYRGVHGALEGFFFILFLGLAVG